MQQHIYNMSKGHLAKGRSKSHVTYGLYTPPPSPPTPVLPNASCAKTYSEEQLRPLPGRQRCSVRQVHRKNVEEEFDYYNQTDNYKCTIYSQVPEFQWEIDRLISPIPSNEVNGKSRKGCDVPRLQKLAYTVNYMGLKQVRTNFVYDIPETPFSVRWDCETGKVHFTPLWRIIFGRTPNLEHIKTLCYYNPHAAVSCGQCHANVQGIWLDYKDAKNLARLFCWRIKGELIPLFGEEFPILCNPPINLDPNCENKAIVQALREQFSPLPEDYSPVFHDVIMGLKLLPGTISQMRRYQPSLAAITTLD